MILSPERPRSLSRSDQGAFFRVSTRWFAKAEYSPLIAGRPFGRFAWGLPARPLR